MAELNVLTKSVTKGSGSTAGTLTFRIYADYTITNSDTSATITSSLKLGYTKSGGGSWGSILVEDKSGTTRWSLNNDTVAKCKGVSGSSFPYTLSTANKTATITKTHSAQSIPVYAVASSDMGLSAIYYNAGKSQKVNTYFGSSATVYITVPAKTHYTVSYNANSGTGAPAAQTKWYGETLKLQTGTPTKTGYTFKGWATSSTGAVAYAAGANYTGNANLTLYAVWEPYHYDVIFDANGGTGAPAKQVKDYGTNLTLTTSKPTFTGYTFKGWATSTAIAAQGTVNYASGATYSANAAVTLYAVWELTYEKPTLSSTTFKIERCLQDGTFDDEGKYARITFDWSIFRTDTPRYYGDSGTGPYSNNSISNMTATVGTQSNTASPTTSSGRQTIIVGNGTFDTDTAYDVSVSITDSQTIYSDNTTVIYGVLPLTFFPFDYNADATAVGFFMPAPDTGNGAYFAKDVTVNSEFYIAIDTTASSGTDYDITTILTALGWDDLLS